jgi:uncharacterized surface protein with fasciclin (FAS1) repeats
MRAQRTILALALSSVAAFGVAACGSDSDSDSSSTSSTPAATTPAAKNIVGVAQGTNQLSTLVQAVTAADLATTLQGKGPYTVFAPTDQAFQGLPKGTLDTLLKPANKDQLTSVLTYHVVPGKVTAAQLKDGQELTTVNGEKLTVSIDGKTVKVGDATVTKADVPASNGVVHVIDTVLQPAS